MRVEPFIFRDLGGKESVDPNNTTNIPLNDNSNNPNNEGNTEAVEEIVEITYTEDDIISAKNQGIQEGIQQGKSESIEIDKQLIASLTDFSNKVEGLFNAHHNIIAVEKEITTQASVDIAHKMTLIYPDEAIMESIKIMVDDIYETVITKPKIVISAHNNLQEKLDEYIGNIFNKDRYSGFIDIKYSADIPINDFSIKWHDGGIQRDSEKIWQEIEKIINHSRLPISKEILPINTDEVIAQKTEVDNTTKAVENNTIENTNERGNTTETEIPKEIAKESENNDSKQSTEDDSKQAIEHKNKSDNSGIEVENE